MEMGGGKKTGSDFGLQASGFGHISLNGAAWTAAPVRKSA
jgi:hypothetical protein